jgi:hypothetical protein
MQTISQHVHLAPFHFFLFPKIKNEFKNTDTSEIQKTITRGTEENKEN